MKSLVLALQVDIVTSRFFGATSLLVYKTRRVGLMLSKYRTGLNNLERGLLLSKTTDQKRSFRERLGHLNYLRKISEKVY